MERYLKLPNIHLNTNSSKHGRVIAVLNTPHLSPGPTKTNMINDEAYRETLAWLQEHFSQYWNLCHIDVGRGGIGIGAWWDRLNRIAFRRKKCCPGETMPVAFEEFQKGWIKKRKAAEAPAPPTLRSRGPAQVSPRAAAREDVEADDDDQDDDIIFCICNDPTDKSNIECVIQCEECQFWHHGECEGFKSAKEAETVQPFVCTRCRKLSVEDAKAQQKRRRALNTMMGTSEVPLKKKHRKKSSFGEGRSVPLKTSSFTQTMIPFPTEDGGSGAVDCGASGASLDDDRPHTWSVSIWRGSGSGSTRVEELLLQLKEADYERAHLRMLLELKDNELRTALQHTASLEEELSKNLIPLADIVSPSVQAGSNTALPAAAS
mmetsp:Transcript_18781/g.43971  ORF Transcript_18781/g.43971 Transcript_18781/m.43971 type:complete len:376 (-) Transcript_18781:630-1757(-)